MQMPWMKIVVIGFALIVGGGAVLLTKKSDGVIEQAAEAVLRTQGVDIDLSPE